MSGRASVTLCGALQDDYPPNMTIAGPECPDDGSTQFVADPFKLWIMHHLIRAGRDGDIKRSRWWAGLGWDEQKVGWIDHLAWVHFGHKTLLCGDQIGVILGLLAQVCVMQRQGPGVVMSRKWQNHTEQWQQSVSPDLRHTSVCGVSGVTTYPHIKWLHTG